MHNLDVFQYSLCKAYLDELAIQHAPQATAKCYDNCNYKDID